MTTTDDLHPPQPGDTIQVPYSIHKVPREFSTRGMTPGQVSQLAFIVDACRLDYCVVEPRLTRSKQGCVAVLHDRRLAPLRADRRGGPCREACRGLGRSHAPCVAPTPLGLLIFTDEQAIVPPESRDCLGRSQIGPGLALHRSTAMGRVRSGADFAANVRAKAREKGSATVAVGEHMLTIEAEKRSGYSYQYRVVWTRPAKGGGVEDVALRVGIHPTMTDVCFTTACMLLGCGGVPVIAQEATPRTVDDDSVYDGPESEEPGTEGGHHELEGVESDLPMESPTDVPGVAPPARPTKRRGRAAKGGA